MSQQLNIAHGTQTAVIGTEHTLDTENGAGIFTIMVNLRNMANNDILELRAYQKVLAADSQSWLCYDATFSNVQGDAAAVGSSAEGDVITVSPAIVSGVGPLVFTLKQTNGTGRNFDWRVDQIA